MGACELARLDCFPVSVARGASFDRTLERNNGDAVGKEARAQGANLFAGVCINLLRQETYGEDPYPVGGMGKALTESVQAHQQDGYSSLVLTWSWSVPIRWIRRC